MSRNSSKAQSTTMDGDHYLVAFIKWLRAHERRLAQSTAANLLPGRRVVSQASWLSAAPKEVKPLTLRIDPHHLAYLLLRFEEAGLTSALTGPLDLPLDFVPTRPLSFVGILQNGGDLSSLPSSAQDKSDTSSILSAVSTTFSFGSSWFSSSSSQIAASKAKDILLSEAKYVYASFTKLPSLHLSPALPPPPLNAFIKGFETIPDNVYLPLYTFKSIQSLVLDSLDPLSLLGWDFLADSLKTLEVRRSGMEDVSNLFVDAVVDDAKRRQGKSIQSRRGEEEEVAKVLPPTKWRSLRRLALPQNDITFIASCPWSHFDSLVHLDLSSNLLVAIPSGLSNLISLRSLNLSDNMIDSILSISSQLGAIVSLNLSRNRLTSLCGLERLLNLRSIEVTRNLLEDSGEIGRLTSLPYLQEVWCAEDNVFNTREKLFDWRVALFTSFHANGNTTIHLDGSGPSWQESRWIGSPETKSRLQAAKLEQKAAEDQAALRAKKVSARQRNASTATTIIRDEQQGNRKVASRPQSPDEQEVKSQSPPTARAVAPKQKKRKAPRRIVNLDGTTTLVSPPPTTVASFVTAAEEPSKSAESSALPSPALPPPTPEEPPNQLEEPRVHQRSTSAPYDTSTRFKTASHRSRPQMAPINSSNSGRSSTLGRLSKDKAARPTINNTSFFDPPTGTSEADAFRNKIEALRAEVGDNWLNVLNETELGNTKAKSNGEGNRK